MWIGGGWCDPERIDRPHRKRPHLGSPRGVLCDGAVERLRALAERLRHVRVLCGDWTRAVGKVALGSGTAGVFCDPPYAVDAGRDGRLYSTDSANVAADCREWAIAHGDDPRLRIILCGLAGEHSMPGGWRCLAWETHGGYSNGSKRAGQGKANRTRERVWLSPHCLPVQ